MKHVFIINPEAGASNSADGIISALKNYVRKIDFTVYVTMCPGDAVGYVKKTCEKFPNDKIRFYACGGDGTLNEVVSGTYGFPNASVTCYAGGSGNDYIKYYGTKENFTDIDGLINAVETPVDLIRVNNRYGINAAHFGFDTCVAQKLTEYRRIPIIGGKHAYKSSVIYALLHAMKTKCSVSADGILLNTSGKILLCTLANGKYVGGSYKCAPKSDNADGLLEVCLVSPVSRFVFMKLVKFYTAGLHLSEPQFARHLVYRRAKTVTVDFPYESAISLDGEIIKGKHFEIEVIPGAMSFAVPASCAASSAIKA